MSLKELGSLVERVHFLLMLIILLLDNRIKSHTSFLLFDTFSVLLLDLGELLLLVLKISLSLITLLVPLAHFLIIRFKSTGVLLVCIFVAREEVLLGCLVSSLDREILALEIVNSPLQLRHVLLVALLAMILEFLAIIE